MKTSRRLFLGSAVSGFYAYALQAGASPALAGEGNREKRCLMLWMNGGPSQLDTVDPKPGTATGGELKPIKTATPGLQLSETLPQIAQHFDQLSVIRNLTSQEGEHLRGQYYLHTGFKFVPGFPRPALGAVASHQAGKAAMPHYVVLGGRGFGPAYLGPDHAPFGIENLEQSLALMKSIRNRRNRLRLLQDLGAPFDNEHRDQMLERRRAMIASIDSLVTTPFVDALDVSRESAGARSRYGEGGFAQSCLAARRLLEGGVRFVEVQQDGWDTHQNNFPAVRRLCQSIDRPWAALMSDLKSSGLLQDTVVVWMGEFGRTPRINGNRGRDHFPAVTPVVLGGGGLKGGRAVGKTDRQGARIDGPAYRVPDLLATILGQLGVAPDQEFRTSFDSPTAATDNGQVIRELVS